MKKINFWALSISILFAEAVGFLSALISGNMSGAYDSFIMPPLSPPAILFPIAWVILYAFMGAAAYFVWDSTRGTAAEKSLALRLYLAQLLVNFSWSIFI